MKASCPTLQSDTLNFREVNHHAEEHLYQSAKSIEDCVKFSREKFDIGSKVLLLAHWHTGNNVFCTPAIRFLKRNYPDTVFDVVALNKRGSECFEGNSDINALYILDTKRAIKKIAGNYTTIICLNRNSMYLLDGLSGHIKCVSEIPGGIHHADHILQQIANFTNCELHESDRKYRIQVHTTLIESLLDTDVIGKGDILICMHLGIARTAIHGWKFFFKNRATHNKIWPVNKYMALGKILIEANPRIRIIITGTKHESFLGKQFEKAVPRTINLIGKTSVSDIIGILNRSNFFISHDCGILHVASASQVPIIALFSPTDPIRVGPYPMSQDRFVIKRLSMANMDPHEVATVALRHLDTTNMIAGRDSHLMGDEKPARTVAATAMTKIVTAGLKKPMATTNPNPI